MSDNIKVVVKVRPLISREIVDKLPYQWRVQSNTLYQLDSNGRDFGQTFTFDKVYNENTKTTDVYNDVAKPIVEAATAGFNGTIFAYGQTSSGKTFTMTGTENSPGIITLSVLNLFEIIKNIPDRDFLVRVSYIEIYNETLKDLLDMKKDNIKIHETYQGSIKVDASERVTSSPEEVLEAMREGEANRQTGATNLNEKSSRSHSIFQITIESRQHIEGEEQSGCVNVSQLNLVDLAGSERAGQTGATGIRFKEGTHINKSLSALALVIKQLSDDPNKHANYRDSKLTRILQNSLGGNAKTSIICAITPAALEETVSTLQFATRAKAIKNKPEVNAVATDATMIQKLTKKLSKLQSLLEEKKNVEQMLETKKHVEQDLQKKIANLQKLILNGFGQTRNSEHIGGTRRKLPPRRITISTLHSIDEDPAPMVPKFCTPSIKYNPMVIPNPSEFVPIQNTSKLSSLPEEPARLITPPPNERKVNFNEDVIEIDSDDDDDSSTIPTCSPYHKCYSETKTPPCILRKNLNRAEKNYLDIMELTEREKMYKPDVVELMEKLELSRNMTVKLQDEVEMLKENTKQKDLEMEHLKGKIKKTEEEVQNYKLKVENLCKEYDTKLTDWEVTHDTLKKKSKLREEELLSLLEEHKKHKKCEDIGKLPARPIEKDVTFMNLSKDISLVNSDNESSIITSNEEESSEQVQDLVASLQDQLIAKCQTIVQLEANIASQKLSIEFLEQSSHDLQGLVDSVNEKLNYFKNENGLLRTTIDTLNTTISNQKENLEIAQNNMASYNSVIQDLQIKLTKMDNLQNMNISDSVLETMIANEEKVIANNENMKNIIHSFKIALDNRTKEIDQLKSSIQETNNSQNKALIEDLNKKTNQIEILNEEISRLKEQANDNIDTINNLMREKSNLASVEQELTKKLAEILNEKSELNELSKENTLIIDNLKETNKELLHSLSEKQSKVQEYVQLNSELQNRIDELSSKINQMEEEIKTKDSLICTISNQNVEKQEYELQAKSAIEKLISVTSILSGEVHEIPELIDNFVNLISALSTGLTILEDVAMDTVSVKSDVLKENSRLKTEISDLNDKHAMEKRVLQHEVEHLKKSVENHLNDLEKLKEINEKISNELSEHQHEICSKLGDYNILLAECNRLKDAEGSLRSELLHKQEVISTLNEKETEYKIKIDDLEAKLHNLNNALKSKQDQLQVKDDAITKASITIEELKSELEHKYEEINMVQQKTSFIAQVKDQHIENIFKKLYDITNELKIENKLPCENVSGNCYENALLLLDKIISHTSLINSIDVWYDDKLSESNKEIETLVGKNQTLQIKLSQIENENETLSNELKEIYSDNKGLGEKLVKCNKLLEQLEVDLKCKAAQMERIENKAKEWKEQFYNHDISMKQQIDDLQYENEKIKAGYLLLKNETRFQKIDILSQTTHGSDSNLVESFTMSMPEAKSLSNLDAISPPSLLTICCNRIVEAIEPKHNDYNSVTQSSSDTGIQNTANILTSCSTCDQLSLELQTLQQENSSLSAILEQIEIANKELIIEQENIRQEVQLLLEPAQELQKRISSHKTNLSILTATTFAENRSLESQVKGLQHHHSRFHNVCQRDIPEFKRQLRELMVILKGDSTVSEIQNVNLKRYSLPDVLDNNSTVCNLRNESTLDGDLLMLDTNVTLTSTGDNTLVGYDQTCLDLTQTMFSEVSCQTSDTNQAEPNVIHSHMGVLEYDSENVFQLLEVLKEENLQLKAVIDKPSVEGKPKSDVQCSPIKIPNINDDSLCLQCHIKNATDIKIGEEIKHLSQKLIDIQNEKNIIERKYNNLILEMPNTDALVCKLNALEEEYNTKANEVIKLTSSLNVKNKELKILQEENVTLSTQVMDNISEADDLNEEVKKIKAENLLLAEKLLKFESKSEMKAIECTQCQLKDKEKHYVQSKTSPHAKLSRSFSDSDTSSRYNKICTLQSELYAGREDCKVLTEDVATIKQHLDCSNMSMDLDDSMGDSNVFSQAKDFVSTNSQNPKFNMPDIQEERPLDIYALDKMDCYNYYLEIAGEDTELMSNDVKIIDIMKMFHNNLVAKHGNEVENLANIIKDYEECRNKLQAQIDDMVSEHSTLKKSFEDNGKNLHGVQKFISEIKRNVNRINSELSSPKDSETLKKTIKMFEQNFLSTLDYEFGISSVNIFEVIVNKFQDDLMNIEKQCITYQNQTDNLNTELGIANDNLKELKLKLAEKESEYKLLKDKNEKLLEISSAVTRDIVRKEQEMHKSLRDGCQKLFELNLIISDLDFSESSSKNVNILVDRVINQFKLGNYRQLENEKETLSLEVKKSKTILVEKEQELTELKTQIQTLKNINNNVTQDLTEKEVIIETLKTVHDDLNKAYDTKIQENINNSNMIDKLTEEINSLKETINNKESIISSLSENGPKITKLLDSLKDLQQDNEKLKSINQMILKEKESYSNDLEKSSETIKQNNAEIEKMTSDILVLRESLKEATSIIESLKQEVQKLSVLNADLKQNFEEKVRDCSRLELNIKTHEKTAEIQSRMIVRLKKQKEEDDKVIDEKQAKINEVSEKYNTLQNEFEELKLTKESLETRITELKEAVDKPRLSLDAIADSSRRRRQSMHDSRRLLGDLDEHRNLEAVFESRQQPDDLFMDVDGDDASDRSTPFGLSKGRDSLLSRTDQSDKDEEHLSRPSSVLATRRRRQSIHDMHRGVARQTPSPHDLSSRIPDELRSVDQSDFDEVKRLREQLTSCQLELEDLKEKYRELDEECETCAEYLRERDAQCTRLRKEKVALEKQVTELKSCNPNSSQSTPSKPSVAHVAVNTDEDWANLHAVVVDRMSYDAEVEKNKRLTKAIEELRFQKQDLKNTITKMQKALEKHSSKDTRELEATKEELKSVKKELEELKVSYKELDEECETCASYLKEREEQCRRLKEAKAALETKLQELQEDAHTLAHSHSVRKKRQTIHDMNRNSVVDQSDASTETSEDFLSYQVERDDSRRAADDTLREMKRLKMIIEKLTHQKAALEQQLKTQAAPAQQPMYVATGSAIVQNQQLTDVMKENHRLKKIYARLVNICKKRGKYDANRENEDPCEQG